MKTSVRYPMRFRARPPRCANQKEVVCSFLHVCDVPEVSSNEVSTVFEARTAIPHSLVEYDGRLFRKIGAAGSEETARCLETAFLVERDQAEPWRFTFEGGNRTEAPPASKALTNIAVFRMWVSGDGRKVEEAAWPAFHTYYGTIGGYTRDSYKFEELEPRLKDIDAAQFAEAREEHENEGGKLLLVGGDYWIETTPPAVMVGLEGYKTSARAVAELVHLPNWIDGRLDRQYFPLGEMDEARDYLERLNGQREEGNDPYEDYSGEAAVEAQDSPLLSFDHGEYSANRTALVLGTDVARWITKSPELEEKTGPEAARAALRVRDVAMACGTDMESWPDVADAVPEIVHAWKAIGRKPGWAEIPQNRYAIGNMVCDRALAMSEDMPINLGIDLSARPGP